MPDSKLEVKACPWCQQQPIKRTDSYIPDAVACPNGHTAPMRLSEWNNRPIANNGVSLHEITELVSALEDMINYYKPHNWVSTETGYEVLNKAQKVLSKLQPTAPRDNGKDSR